MNQKFAIIGLSCLFPQADNPGRFWQNIIEGKDVASKATSDELGAEPEYFFDPEKGKSDKCYSLKGGFIRNFRFDPGAYGISPKGTDGFDDVVNWSLYVSGEALKDSGYLNKKSSLSNCGIILGNLSFPTRSSRRYFTAFYTPVIESVLKHLTKRDEINVKGIPIEDHFSSGGFMLSSAPSSTVSRLYSLGGPHYCIDAACATSLYAIKLACDLLAVGKAEMMLAGAVCCSDPLFIHMGFSILQAYPEENKDNAPLDISSSGIMSSEGAGMVVLKRYDDALKDGNKIYAVIAGSGLSNDGKGKFLLAPNKKGQLLALERAYSGIGIEPDNIDYLECHATGTPLGDITEIETIESFFGKTNNVPLIGTVKSNTGHLLTAAGMPGIFKILYSMSKGIIPSTIRVKEPLQSKKNIITGSRIVRDNTPWPDHSGVKRAAINSFGFGGTNAHMILEEPGNQGKKLPSNKLDRLKRIAIIGMDAHFGKCEDLAGFYYSIFNAEKVFTDVPPSRWRGIEKYCDFPGMHNFKNPNSTLGAYIEGFDIEISGSGILPKEIEKLQPQQTLMLKTADNAILDAGFKKNPGTDYNTAVIVAMDTELAIHQLTSRWDFSWQIRAFLKENKIHLSEPNMHRLENFCMELLYPCGSEPISPSQFTSFIGNIIASRISSVWNFTGPAFTISSGVSSAQRAVEIAQVMLTTAEVDSVVVGAVHLAGGFEHTALHNSSFSSIGESTSPGFHMQPECLPSGDGAGAVVLKTLEAAEKENCRVYAVVDSIGFSKSEELKTKNNPSASISYAVTGACREAIKRSSYSSRDIEYIEVSSTGVPVEEMGEIAGITSVYKDSDNQADRMPFCSLGSVKSNIGNVYAASGIAGLIKTSLCLYYGFIPGTPDWSSPNGTPEYWENSPFYVPVSSRPWIRKEPSSPRVAAVNSICEGSLGSHIIMSEAPHNFSVKRKNVFIRQSSERLFPVAGSSFSELKEGLDRLKREIEKTDSLKRTAAKNYFEFQKAEEPVYIVSLVGNDRAGVLKEISTARKGIEGAMSTGRPWQSPSGSYFTPSPLGKNAKIAFVYPGSFTSYIGLGRTLFQLFPDLLDNSENQFAATDRCLFSRLLYPRSMYSTESEYENFREKFKNSQLEMISIGASFSAFYTKILKKYLKINPVSVFGYSMGETSGMLASQGVWAPHTLAESFQTSPLFRDKLVGENKILDGIWGFSNENANERWVSLTLFISAEKVKAALKNYRNVYLTFINTPEEVIISGNRRGCFEVIKMLGCQYVEMDISAVVHSELVFREYYELVKIHDIPVTGKSQDVDFYSGVEFDKMKLDRDALAHNSAKVCCSTVDFNRLVTKVYDDGARIFIEVGAGATCTRWIDEILNKSPHLAVPVNRKGVSDIKTFVSLLARLLSHGVKADPMWLFQYDNCRNNKLLKRIILGGENKFGNIRDRQQAELNPGRRNLKCAGSDSKDPEYGTQKLDGNRNVIWDERALLEFASGSISAVFGKEYAIIDTFSRRTRLPLPPYLFVTRVTKLKAEKGQFKPSFIQTEYDIPENAWYSTDTQVPWAVVVESGQCDLLLISYLGIDIELKGQRVYRLLNCNFTFLGNMPREGDILRYDISINSFSESGDTKLFFFSYECFANNELIMKMDGGCAGFFSQNELSAGQGVVYTTQEIEEKRNVKKRFFVPLLVCEKTIFEREDLLKLKDGDLQACFGESYFPGKKNPSLRFPPEKIMMIDRITSVDRTGGAWGLGKVVAEKDIAPDHWYFPCHFKDDNVMPGPLQAEGGAQLLQFYMLYLGLQSTMKDARFQPVLNLHQKVRCRKEVPPRYTKLVYILEVKEIGMLPEPYMIADVEVVLDGAVAVFFENLGWRLAEKNSIQFSAENIKNDYKKDSGRVLFDEKRVLEFTLGSVEKCFGPEFAVYDTHKTSRIPNTDFRFITRILSSDGELYKFENNPHMISCYDVPNDAWYFQDCSNPVMPFSILMEIALQPCGFFSTYLGTVLRYPDTDFYFRNLDGEGQLFKYFDLRGKTVENKVTLISSVALGDTIIQSYTFELKCGEKTIFTGSTSFGFFTKDALSGQTGLDSGKPVLPWYKEEKVPESALFQIDMTAEDLKAVCFQSFQGKPQYLPESDHLNLIQGLKVMKHGGIYRKGYIHATKQIKPWEWFFTCHFYQDPVMPGSLGVEAMLQAVRAFALLDGVGNHLKCPKFSHKEQHKTVWKYRGQILRHDREMSLEVHIKSIESEKQKVVITSDASLWNGNIRIYEVKDLAVAMIEGTKDGGFIWKH